MVSTYQEGWAERAAVRMKIRAVRTTTLAQIKDDILDLVPGSEIVEWMRLPTNDHVDMLEKIKFAALDVLQMRTGKIWVNQAWKFYLDHFPIGRGPIELPIGKAQAGVVVKYLDTDGVEQTLASTNYLEDDFESEFRRPRIYLKTNKDWPDTQNERRAVWVEATVGYGTADDVPPTLEIALKEYMATLYDHPESLEFLAPGATLQEVPGTLDNLLSRYSYPVIG